MYIRACFVCRWKLLRFLYNKIKVFSQWTHVAEQVEQQVAQLIRQLTTSAWEHFKILFITFLLTAVGALSSRSRRDVQYWVGTFSVRWNIEDEDGVYWCISPSSQFSSAVMKRHVFLIVLAYYRHATATAAAAAAAELSHLGRRVLRHGKYSHVSSRIHRDPKRPQRRVRAQIGRGW